jgi:hypothetical protein
MVEGRLWGSVLGRLPSAHMDGHVIQASEKPAQIQSTAVACANGKDAPMD